MRQLQPFLLPLRSRSFLLLWVGQVASLLGSYAADIAWIWLLTDLTGSTALMGAVLAASYVPSIVLLAPGGAWVDRGDSRRIALWSQVANATLGFSLAVLVTVGKISMLSFMVFAVLFGVVRAISSPALVALSLTVVDEQAFNAANSLRQLGSQTASLLGPPLGGYLIARWSVGVALAFDAATFAVAALTIWRVRARAPAAAEAGPRRERGRAWKEDLVAGFRFLISQRGMLAIVTVFSLTNALNNVEFVLVPRLVRFDLTLPASAYGLLGTFLGLGVMLGALILGLLGDRIGRRSLAICSGLAASGVAIVAMGAAQGLWSLCLAYAAYGLAFGATEIVSATLWQRIVPSDLRGRVFGLLAMVSMATNPLGLVAAGVIGEVAGARLGLVFAGGCIVVLSVLALLVPAVQRLDRHLRPTI